MSEQYSLSPVEQAIRQAMRDGLFDNLPGMGKPLNINWNEENQSPEDMRLANKIMKDHQEFSFKVQEQQRKVGKLEK